jgi:uncharacterized membrane protein YdbT with pleckstrin-like domain
MNPKTTKSKAMHAFITYPSITVESQGPDEEVILVLRAHPVTQISWILNVFGLLIILLAANFFLPAILQPNQILFLNIFWLCFVFAYIIFNFLSWFFNVGVVTNERIVDIDFYDIIYKEVTEARINKVEDVTAKSGGFFQSFFNYGDVFVQTAGTEKNIEFLKIPQPAEAVRIINDLLPH